MSNTNNKHLVYPELSYNLTGIFYKIHNDLGRFYKEKQYANILEKELENLGFIYEREQKLSALDRVDFVIENKILVDIKAKNFITRADYYQMKRYLKAAGMKLGLIVNFRSKYLKPKRVLNSEI